MIEALLSIFTSSGAGALIGAIGSWATKRENRLLKKLQFDHETDMATIETTQMTMEFEHALAVAEKEIEQTQTEGDIAIDVAETNAFTESLKIQQVKSGNGAVDAIRFLMRPMITVYLLSIATYLAYSVHQLVDGLESMSIIELMELYTMIISQVFFLATTAVTWWFGSRGSK